jgi:Lrp/AsnC family transcriptional regulator of ectoine degradation
VSVKLDPFDLRILAEVQRDGRITKLALAERVGLSPTPCWTRLNRLERAGIITGYHARLALRRLAPFAQLFVEVTLGSHHLADFDRFEQTLKEIPEVVACWAVGGGIDYIVQVLARDIDSYQRLIDQLLKRDLGIDRYFTYIVTRIIKDEPVLPLPTLIAAPSA